MATRTTASPENLPPDGWPGEVIEALAARFGQPQTWERLGGMSSAEVYRVRCARRTVIVKVSDRGTESLFYTAVAPQVRAAGIPVPGLWWSAEADGRYWLALEEIPAPLPIPDGHTWQPDPRMVGVLARLHALAIDAPVEPFRHPKWRWTDAMSDAALTFFAPAEAARIAGPVHELQQRARHLADEWCWLSGDPNPSNWGVRADGGLVLFDWELFSRGMPAVDLSILVVGLGDRPKYERLAAVYVQECAAIGLELPWSDATVARDIALAKAWSVVSFLSRVVTGEGRVPDRTKQHLAELAPAWLCDLATGT